MADGPFIRWAGSKKQILDHLAPFASGSQRYVEPFAGSACLFFRLQPEEAVLGDLNDELIATYRAVKRSANAVHAQLLLCVNSREEYLKMRAVKPKGLTSVEAAARFIYLNRFCFNGLYRTNLKGEFNVPYGGGKSGSLPTLHHLRLSSKLLGHAKLVPGRFQKVLSLVRAGDFVYMDPPFSVAARRVFKEYNPAVFSQSDVIDLRNWMERLARERIAFLVSYAESAESEYLAKGFRVKRLAVKRHIAGSFANRVTSDEVLIYP